MENNIISKLSNHELRLIFENNNKNILPKVHFSEDKKHINNAIWHYHDNLRYLESDFKFSKIKCSLNRDDNYKKLKNYKTLNEELNIPYSKRFSINDKNQIIQSSPVSFEISSNAIEIAKFLKDKNITCICNHSTSIAFSYRASSQFFPEQSGYYYATTRSTYGHFALNVNYNEYRVRLIASVKTTIDENITNIIKSNSIDPKQIVVLDLETTGLNPITDDIIEIALYDIETKKHFSKRLPLVKNTYIRKEISNINHITTAMLKNAKPLNQNEINRIYKDFKLDQKIILVWTGSNYFDIQFLGVYFVENKLKGFNRIKFYNGKDIADANQKVLNTYDHSKDGIAISFGISTQHSHNALEDCKIEAKIYSIIFKLVKELK